MTKINILNNINKAVVILVVTILVMGIYLYGYYLVSYNNKLKEKSYLVFNNDRQEISNPFEEEVVEEAEEVVETKPEPQETSQVVMLSNPVNNVADLSYWAWPTDSRTITSYYGYRGGSLHGAIDIAGGYGSNIYAPNNGTVIEVGGGCSPGYTSCNGGRGNYIVINHNNGNYYTVYMHLLNIYIGVGTNVNRGDVIGGMGNTGYVLPTPTPSSPYMGTHLHFAVYIGHPYGGGYSINPLNLY